MNSGTLLAAVVNLNGPGRYLHWSIFTVSVANLVLIAVMVVIFGAALLIPFPRHGQDRKPLPSRDSATNGHRDAVAVKTNGSSPAASDLGDDDDAAMWTSRLRRRVLRVLPPGKLLPDRQPAYVSSWIYVFGVASLSTLGVVIVSGFIIAAGRPRLVAHQPGRPLLQQPASVERRGVHGLLGHSPVGKVLDGRLAGPAVDDVDHRRRGLCGFGRGVLHRLPVPAELRLPVDLHERQGRLQCRRRRRFFQPHEFRPNADVAHRVDPDRASRRWSAPTSSPCGCEGSSTRSRSRPRGRAAGPGSSRKPTSPNGAAPPAATTSSRRPPSPRWSPSVLVVALAGLLSSPDIPPVTVATWAKVAPADFVATAASELAGTSETATYGPPYSSGNGSTQTHPVLSRDHRRGAPADQLGAGVRPLPSGEACIYRPRSRRGARPLQRCLGRQRAAWNTAYAKAVTKLTFSGGRAVVPPATDGPIPLLIATELTLARSGALDADLISNQGFYGTDFTKPLLFLEDGQYFSNLATADHLGGTQWGVMNETGQLPGAALAVALHALVPGTGLRQFGQR